ncbi:MAG: phosphoribosyltransferase [Candidatus Diapherotrites archaeon]|nr:phosphoribosyltransferase [Candidatus Diapherotrites archaeon]
MVQSDERGTESEHKIGGDAERVKEFINTAEKMTAYIRSEKISRIIVGGSGAQPLAYAVKHIWRAKYGEELPRFTAVATTFFQTRAYSAKELAGIINAKLHTANPEKERVLVLEEYVQTGRTIRNLKEALRMLGFRKIKTAVMKKNLPWYKYRRLNFVGKYKEIPYFWNARRAYLSKYSGMRKQSKYKTRATLETMRGMRKEIRDGVAAHIRRK